MFCHSHFLDGLKALVIAKNKFICYCYTFRIDLNHHYSSGLWSVRTGPGVALWCCRTLFCQLCQQENWGMQQMRYIFIRLFLANCQMLIKLITLTCREQLFCLSNLFGPYLSYSWFSLCLDSLNRVGSASEPNSLVWGTGCIIPPSEQRQFWVPIYCWVFPYHFPSK
jgi:hypothetical protein